MRRAKTKRHWVSVLLVDELRNLKGEAVDDALRAFFHRTAVLR